MRNLGKILGFLGLILILTGLLLALQFASQVWYTPFVIGGTLFLGYLNDKNKQGVFNIYRKNKMNFLRIWAVYIITALIIEVLGRYILKLWYYPSFTLTEEIIHVYLIGYPFALFMTYETYVLIHEKVKEYWEAIIVTTVLSAFLHEIPNTFAWEWVYTIPRVTREVLGINVVVIGGWIVLALLAFTVEHVRRKHRAKSHLRPHNL